MRSMLPRLFYCHTNTQTPENTEHAIRSVLFRYFNKKKKNGMQKTSSRTRLNIRFIFTFVPQLFSLLLVFALFCITTNITLKPIRNGSLSLPTSTDTGTHTNIRYPTSHMQSIGGLNCSDHFVGRWAILLDIFQRIFWYNVVLIQCCCCCRCWADSFGCAVKTTRKENKITECQNTSRWHLSLINSISL